MNPKERYLESPVLCPAAPTAAAPVSNGAGVEDFTPPVHGLLLWLDNWFKTSPEERMANDYLAYWS
jgi:hypothetical protein